ncbi:hypothetical protein HAX54_037308 [Datura stramonium]|uniref:Alpha/beta hydrolase fold-3 domain-containing protein n=1 Tax=Datura stramonium TaxID=4076 RepID=A0ABS8RGW6_DATST|nr:hypothetical protein [Datura stramonium]
MIRCTRLCVRQVLRILRRSEGKSFAGSEVKTTRCKKVLFFVAEKDFRKKGDELLRGFEEERVKGGVELMETKREGHCIEAISTTSMSEKAVALVNKLVDFLKQEQVREAFLSLTGMALVDPYFGNGEPDGLWTYLCPKSNGIDDSRFNPAAHPRMLSKLNCSKILVCTASKDFLRDRAWTYYETLKKSGWEGELGIKEIEGEGHVFHLLNQTSEKAKVCVLPSNNPNTGVQSKDVVVSPENNVSARLYLPQITENNQKFPLLVYIHGGAFAVESAFSTSYDNYLHSLVAEANLVVVSVDYRLAPEHPLPPATVGANIAHDMMVRASAEENPLGDAVKIVGMIIHGLYAYDEDIAEANDVQVYKDGRVERHRKHDFAPPSIIQPQLPPLVAAETSVLVALPSDSAGANIAHNMMMRASVDEDKLGDGLRLVGMALIHPYFLGNNGPDRIWSYCCPENPKTDDPRFNPAAHPSLLSKLVCSNILICTGERIL